MRRRGSQPPVVEAALVPDPLEELDPDDVESEDDEDPADAADDPDDPDVPDDPESVAAPEPLDSVAGVLPDPFFAASLEPSALRESVR
jgi:hypothetical protein